jgi:hypothetical protein
LTVTILSFSFSVSATFAASLVISPALGAYLNDKYSEPLIVALATAIAVLDVFFILVAVPESLPEKVRPSSWGTVSWEQADPFSVRAVWIFFCWITRIFYIVRFFFFAGFAQSWHGSTNFNAMCYSIIILFARSRPILLHICLLEIENEFFIS